MNFTCPRCGAINQLENPDPFPGCEYCHSSLYIDFDSIIAVYTFAPTIEIQRISLYLKNDFEKIGFREAITIRSTRLVHLPFWLEDEKQRLHAAYSRFPAKTIPIPSATPLFFETKGTEALTIVPVDTDPQSGKKGTLYFVPFFQVLVAYKNREYPFFVNGISGEVFGERLPFIPGERSQRLFPYFLLFFSSFLLGNFLLGGFIPWFLGNSLLIAGFYFLTVFGSAKITAVRK